MTASTNDIRFERVTTAVGAVVHGVELCLEYSATTAERVRQGLHEFGVLFFDFDHPVDADEFFAFSKLFGEPEQGYRLSTRGGESGAAVIDSALAPMREVRINCWHSDGTCFERPPQMAMLTPVELPEVGGDTMWASMYAAWEGLSSHHQRLLEGVEVLHSTARLPFLDQSTSAVHPAVIRDAVTGRTMLFVNSNYTERILGMNDSENDAMLAMLFAHVNTPEFHVRLRWRPGVIAVWEERVTQHRGVADYEGPRKLRRLTFPGERPSMLASIG